MPLKKPLEDRIIRMAAEASGKPVEMIEREIDDIVRELDTDGFPTTIEGMAEFQMALPIIPKRIWALRTDVRDDGAERGVLISEFAESFAILLFHPDYPTAMVPLTVDREQLLAIFSLIGDALGILPYDMEDMVDD